MRKKGGRNTLFQLQPMMMCVWMPQTVGLKWLKIKRMKDTSVQRYTHKAKLKKYELFYTSFWCFTQYSNTPKPWHNFTFSDKCHLVFLIIYFPRGDSWLIPNAKKKSQVLLSSWAYLVIVVSIVISLVISSSLIWLLDVWNHMFDINLYRRLQSFLWWLHFQHLCRRLFLLL